MRYISWLIASFISICVALFVPHSAHATMLGIDGGGIGCSAFVPPNLYLIDEESGTHEQLELAVEPPWRYCGTLGLSRRQSDGAFYTAGYEFNREAERSFSPVLIKIVPGTWAMTTVGRLTPRPGAESSRSDNIWSLAFSPAGALYAAYQLFSGTLPPRFDLVRLNPDTGAEEARVTLSPGILPLGIEFSSDGTLYGWSPSIGLLTINPATGAVTDVRPGVEDEQVISSIAFAADGTLYGFPGFMGSGSNEGWIYSIDTRSGVARRASYMGPDWWPWVDGVASRGPRLHVVERPPRRFRFDNLYLFDCMPCPQCFGRMCDPRVNSELDRFFLIEPKSGIAEIFSRSKIGLRRQDGPLKAGAPLKVDGKTLFVVSAPSAGQAQAGAILFLDAKGNVISRIDGGTDEMLGLAMDVRGSDIVVALAKEHVRLDGTKVVARMPLDKSLFAQQALRIAFADDIDGDERPEIRLGAPYATANGLTEVGVIQLIGSRTGQILNTEVGKVARQHLGFSLPR